MCKKISQLLSLFFTGFQFSLALPSVQLKNSLTFCYLPPCCARHIRTNQSSLLQVQVLPSCASRLPSHPPNISTNSKFSRMLSPFPVGTPGDPGRELMMKANQENDENRVNFDATEEDCAIGHDLWKGSDWMVGGRRLSRFQAGGDWLHSTFFTFFKDSYERAVCKGSFTTTRLLAMTKTMAVALLERQQNGPKTIKELQMQ